MKSEVSNEYQFTPTSAELDSISCISKKKVEKLAFYLSSYDLALGLTVHICSTINELAYKKTQVLRSVELIEHHFMYTTKEGLSLLSSFQKSVVDYISNYKDKTQNKDSRKKTINAVKKVYLYMCEREFFIADTDSEDFNIYDIAPISKKEQTQQLHASLKLVCPNENIHRETLLFLRSKKVQKNYLRIYVDVFQSTFNTNKKWGKEAIEDGLMNLRELYNSINDSKNTQYHDFNRALELFQNLKDKGLINQHVHLPKNIKRPSNSSLMRSTNPTIGSINIDTLQLNSNLSSAKTMIDDFHNDLIEKLSVTVNAAKEKVLEDYRHYYLYDKILNKKIAIKNWEQVTVAANIVEAKNYYNGSITQVEREYEIDDEYVRRCNGLTLNLISAMHIIIVDELGINPEPLYNLQVNATGIKREYIKIEEDGSVRINIIKWRQRRLQRRVTTESHLLPPEELSLEKIDASFCLQYAVKASEKHRKFLNSNRLWVHESHIKVNEKIAFDSVFRRFCDTYLPKEMAELKPTLMKIRSSRAIELYIRDHGNVISCANYLGNKVKTTLNTYIPLFLQEIIYRRKISVFQHIYLILATAKDVNRLELLNMTQKEYDECLTTIYENTDFGGPLFEKLLPKSHNKSEMECEYFFICSEDNFSYIINYLKNTTDDGSEFYKVCNDALNKAKTGNIAYKRMIRNAEKMGGS